MQQINIFLTPKRPRVLNGGGTDLCRYAASELLTAKLVIECKGIRGKIDPF